MTRAPRPWLTAAALLALCGPVGAEPPPPPPPPSAPAPEPVPVPVPAPAAPVAAEPPIVAPSTATPSGAGLPPARGRRELRLRLAEAHALGRARNLELQAAAFDPSIACAAITVAEGSFDTLLTASFSAGRAETLPNNVFTGDVVRADDVTVQGGASRKLRDGSRLSVLFEADRLTSNDALTRRDPSWIGGVSVEWTKPLLRGAGDVVMADVRRARNGARVADQALRAVEDQVLLRIETAYWNLAFAREQEASRRAAENVAAELLDLTKVRFDAQVATSLDMADARAGIEARRGERIGAEGATGEAEDALRQLILPFDGSPGDLPVLVPVDDLRLVPPADRVDPRDEDRYVAQALRGRPDLLAALSDLENRDIDVEVAGDGLRPQLDLIARLSSNGLDDGLFSAFGETARGQGFSGSVGLAFEVYLGRRSAHANLRIAQWVRSQAAVRQQDLRNRIVAEVRAALRDLATARARGEAARGEIAAAREALSGEQLKERNGASTPFLVLQKNDIVTQGVTREGRAAADVRIAIARLWRAVGLLSEQRKT